VLNSKMVTRLVFIVQLWAIALANRNDLGKSIKLAIAEAKVYSRKSVRSHLSPAPAICGHIKFIL